MRIAIITTGGTIAKTYDELEQSLENRRPVIESLVDSLRLVDLNIEYVHALNKDSLELSDSDRRMIIDKVRTAAKVADAVIVIHGTDTLAVTGDWLHREIPEPRIPIILTGAMRPYELRDSDAAQNVTEALLVCRLVGAGVYVAMHNRVLRFPGVIKDQETLTFTCGRP